MNVKMSRKPDRKTAMQLLITEVKAVFPLNDPATFVCDPRGNCIGCSKKLLEFIDSEISYWESALDNGETPTFRDISRFAKQCKKVKVVLVKNGILE